MKDYCFRGECIVKENKTVKISFRMTEEETAKLDAEMALEGFRSRSKYIRKVLLRGRIKRRYLSRNSANIAKQIEILRAEIKRIGVNYNQVVRAVNSMAKLRDKRGNAVITSHTIEGKLTDLRQMMISVLDKVDAISAEVSDNQSSTH